MSNQPQFSHESQDNEAPQKTFSSFVAGDPDSLKIDQKDVKMSFEVPDNPYQALEQTINKINADSHVPYGPYPDPSSLLQGAPQSQSPVVEGFIPDQPPLLPEFQNPDNNQRSDPQSYSQQQKPKSVKKERRIEDLVHKAAVLEEEKSRLALENQQLQQNLLESQGKAIEDRIEKLTSIMKKAHSTQDSESYVEASTLLSEMLPIKTNNKLQMRELSQRTSSLAQDEGHSEAEQKARYAWFQDLSHPKEMESEAYGQWLVQNEVLNPFSEDFDPDIAQDFKETKTEFNKRLYAQGGYQTIGTPEYYQNFDAYRVQRNHEKYGGSIDPHHHNVPQEDPSMTMYPSQAPLYPHTYAPQQQNPYAPSVPTYAQPQQNPYAPRAQQQGYPPQGQPSYPQQQGQPAPQGYQQQPPYQGGYALQQTQPNAPSAYPQVAPVDRRGYQGQPQGQTLPELNDYEAQWVDKLPMYHPNSFVKGAKKQLLGHEAKEYLMRLQKSNLKR